MLTQTKLEYFLALAQNLNITKTAKLMFISQQSLSKQISALEKDLGFPLFSRSPKGVTLTDGGRAMYELFSRFERELTRKRNFYSGVFRYPGVGHHESIDISELVPVFDEAKKKYYSRKDVDEIIFASSSASELQKRVLDGDLGIIFYPAYMHIENPSLEVRAIREMPMYYFFSPGKLPYSKDSSPEDFADARIYLPFCPEPAPEQYRELFGRYIVGEFPTGRPPAFGSMASAVNWGGGVAIDCSMSVLGKMKDLESVELDMKTELLCLIHKSTENQYLRYLFNSL